MGEFGIVETGSYEGTIALIGDDCTRPGSQICANQPIVGALLGSSA
jgi:hypothetical protein